jgi:hypothetical protein
VAHHGLTVVRALERAKKKEQNVLTPNKLAA